MSRQNHARSTSLARNDDHGRTMRIEFRKSRKGKDVLFCERDDGTTTWSELIEGSLHPHVVVPHDLVHYVVELTLELDNAFFGFVARGLDLHASLQPSEKRAMRLEPAVLRAEAAVSALFADLTEGPFSASTRAERLKRACVAWRVAPFEITEDLWEAMRARLEAIATMWSTLPRGGRLELPWVTASVANDSMGPH